MRRLTYFSLLCLFIVMFSLFYHNIKYPSRIFAGAPTGEVFDSLLDCARSTTCNSLDANTNTFKVCQIGNDTAAKNISCLQTSNINTDSRKCILNDYEGNSCALNGQTNSQFYIQDLNVNECIAYWSSNNSRSFKITDCVSVSSSSQITSQPTNKPTNNTTQPTTVSSGSCGKSSSAQCQGKNPGDSCNKQENNPKACKATKANASVCVCVSTLVTTPEPTTAPTSATATTPEPTAVQTTISPTLQPSNPPTATAVPTCETKPYGDADCDGIIDGVDFSLWLNSYCTGYCSKFYADFNNDKLVDENDYYIWYTNRK